MAVIRTILKSSPDANGRHQVLLMLSERGTRSYFTTGFTADLKEFDTSKEGGRFHQGRGVRSFTLERKEEDGSTKSYTNKEANELLVSLERRAGQILKSYSDSHLSWSFERFREDFLNLPKRELFKTFADSVIEKDYTGQGVSRKPPSPEVHWFRWSNTMPSSPSVLLKRSASHIFKDILRVAGIRAILGTPSASGSGRFAGYSTWPFATR